MEKKKRSIFKLKTPDEIRYGSVVYKIEYVPNLKGCYGICDPNKRTIKLRAGMSEERTFSTFIHELLHVIEFEEKVPRFTHWQLNKIERGLVKLICENLEKVK